VTKLIIANLVNWSVFVVLLALLLLQFSKFFGNISDSFKFWKFQTHNMKMLAND
jgi:hypothetical protein